MYAIAFCCCSTGACDDTMCSFMGIGRSARVTFAPLEAVGAASAVMTGVGAVVAEGAGGFVSCLLSHAERASKMTTVQRLMLRRLPRSLFPVVFPLVFLRAPPAAAADPLTATMQCDRAVEPGRLKCSVEAKPEAGHSITWADVAIVSLPDLASALKGRLGQGDATQRDAAGYKWAFALIAKKAGAGEAKVRVRATICEGTSTTRCIPVTVEVTAPVTVGS